jgi:bla regulator protein BlaR1
MSQELISLVANHLWQSTLFLTVAGLLTLPLQKNQARVRYWIWVTASAKFLLPFSLLLNLGGHFSWPVKHMASIEPSVSAFVIEQVAQPFTSDPLPASRPHAAAPPRATNTIPIVLAVIWLCGCGALLLRWGRNWSRIRSAARRGKLLTHGREFEALRRIQHISGSEAPLAMVASDATIEPSVVGIFRPILLWPVRITARLSDEELESILLHEVSHVRRRDNLAGALHLIVETVFWYHPLVWWVGARIVQEREKACDEDVLYRGYASQVYAEGILKVCEFCIASPLACAAGVSGSDLRKRIEAIMNNGIGTRLTFGRKTVLALAALFAFSVPIVVGSMSASLPHPFAAAPSVPAVEPAITPPEQPPAAVEISQQTKPPVDKPASSSPATPTTVPEFEEASIRQCDPDNIPAAPEGMRGGGANSFQMTPGRTHALCMTLATLIRTAYGYAPAEIEMLSGRGSEPGLAFNNVYGLGVEDGVRVRGGPDWVRKQRYTIEAIAQGPSDPATMRGPMLRALIERRFQLKAHIETEEIPAFALTVAKGGLKIKSVQEGDCEQMPKREPGVPNLVRPHSFVDVRRGEKPSCAFIADRNGPNAVLVAGGSTLGVLTLLGGQLNAKVLDKTGITDKFNFTLEFAIDENTPGRLFRTQDIEPSEIPRAATIFTALEEQLGVRLEPARAPREFIVIDHVEQLSPN